MIYNGVLSFGAMDVKRCIIEKCRQAISPERLATQPRAVTCSSECSAAHHYNQTLQALHRSRKAKTKTKTPAA